MKKTDYTVLAPVCTGRAEIRRHLEALGWSEVRAKRNRDGWTTFEVRNLGLKRRAVIETAATLTEVLPDLYDLALQITRQHTQGVAA